MATAVKVASTLAVEASTRVVADTSLTGVLVLAVERTLVGGKVGAADMTLSLVRATVLVRVTAPAKGTVVVVEAKEIASAAILFRERLAEQHV
jgi:hypothetical protein